MLKVKKFLFCIKLKKGCKFIGWLGVMDSLILSLAFIGLLIFDLEDVTEYINNNFPIKRTTEIPLASKK
jgi:hypothetical protein